MKPHLSLPAAPVRTSTTRHRRRQRTERLGSALGGEWMWLGLSILVVAISWYILSMPLWIPPLFVAVVSLPFVLAYLAVQFAGVLVAFDDHR